MARQGPSLEAQLRFLYDQITTDVSSRQWAPLKPWSEFSNRFTVPKAERKAISNRVLLNSHIYQTNYLMILGTFLLYYVLRHPLSIFVLGCITIVWVQARSLKPVIINRRRITRREKYLAASGFTVMSLVLTGVLASFFSVMSIGSALVLSHACFRHTSLRHKVDDMRAQMQSTW